MCEFHTTEPIRDLESNSVIASGSLVIISVASLVNSIGMEAGHFIN